MSVVLAISGGIDSMVMLDIFARNQAVVAHFNHGTRKSANDDAKFVTDYAKKHHLPLILGSSDLGENVSEEIARHHRYNFLKKVSSDNNTEIYTAHHLDDLVESITINFLRGTGWRGLAVLDAPGIHRPFLEPELLPENLQSLVPFDKKTLCKYATKHHINFRQDPTNHEDNYLRNRVRERLEDFPASRKKDLYSLWQQQKNLKHEIDNLVQEILPAPGEAWQRSWFQNLDNNIALELLRAGTLRAGISATRPQLLNFLNAIKTYNSGKTFNLPQDKLIKFSKTEFYLENA